jgi:hypothetical protein
MLALGDALDAADAAEVRRCALALAAAHRAGDRPEAAIDACYQALGLLPADPDVHLMLAELYLDHGWRALAADKLALLGRLTRMTDDSETLARLCALVGQRLSDDERLAALCA